MPERPKLRKDKEIKDALVRFLYPDSLYRDWLPRDDGSGRYERTALREVVVPCEQATLDAVASRLPKEDPADLKPNYLLSEVIEFCPVATLEYQIRGKSVLEEHMTHWTGQLNVLRSRLQNERMYALPFGRFINHDTEDAHQWVSQIKQANLSNSQIFQNCQLAGIPEDAVASVWYYTRPYIVWPTEFPGSTKHVTHIRKSTPVYIERPALTHPKLQKRNPA